ncbi:MAG: beta-lactamase family protein [Bacteroidales bacterium]|nr:beta-lactamase family protein [Bacteroidales bacterium]
MKTIFTTISLTLFIFGTMNAQDEITRYIESKITGKETPGFQYLIADASGVLYEYNGGYANINKKVAVSHDTEFKAYSSTKTLTALAIMQLIEQGKISPDDEIGKILDIPFSEPVTIRQALSHTGGLTSSQGVISIHLASEHEQFDTKAAQESLARKYTKISPHPGKKKKYSNFGYLLLGMVIEKVSGQDYEDYVRENIFERLGDEVAYGFGFNEHTAKAYQHTRRMMHLLWGLMIDRKVFYSGRESHFMGYNDLYLNAASYGGSFANAGTLLKYGQTLMQKDSPLLSDTTKNLLFEEQFLENGKSAGHTLGWFLKERKGTRYFSHPGGGGGYSCEIRIYPDQGIVSVFMMNTTQSFSHLKLLDRLDSYFIR